MHSADTLMPTFHAAAATSRKHLFGRSNCVCLVFLAAAVFVLYSVSPLYSVSYCSASKGQGLGLLYGQSSQLCPFGVSVRATHKSMRKHNLALMFM